MELMALLSPKNIIGFIIVVTRLSGMIITAPLFSKYPIPAQIKAWLVALVAFIMFPMVMANSNFVIPVNMFDMTLFLLKEMSIGLLIGYLANMIFAAIQMAGQMVALQSGLAMSNVLDPATGSQVPVLSEFYVLMTTILFLSLNAHQWLFLAVYQSFIKIPPGIELIVSPALVQQVLYLVSQMFIISMGVVMPIFCVMFILEVLMGILAKMMPQMNIFMVAIPLKISCGLLLMMVFLPPVQSYVINTIQTFMTTILRMFM